MNKKELISRVAEVLRSNNIKKPVSTPKQVFHISDDEGNHKDFVVRKTDKSILYNVNDVGVILEACLSVVEDSAVLKGIREQVSQLSSMNASKTSVASVGAVDVSGIRKTASAWRALDKAMKQAAETSKNTQGIVNKASISSGKESAQNKGIEKGTTKYYKSLKEIDNLLTQVTLNQKRWTAAVEGNSSKDYNKLAGYVQDLKSLRKELKEGQLSAEEFANSMARTRSDIAKSNRKIKVAGEATLAGSIKEDSKTTKILTEGTAEYHKALKQVDTLLTQVRHNQERWTSAKTGKSSEAYKNLGEQEAELKKLRANLTTDKLSNEDFTKKLSKIRSSTTNSTKEIKAAGEATQSWSDRIGSLSAKFGTWLSITQVVMTGVRAIKSMTRNVIDLNTAMTELRKVTDESESTYEKFLNKATSRSKKLGAELTDTVTASADFARLGFNIEDAEKLADIAIIYKNVGDGISDINTASESIIATMQAFGINAQDAMSIVDKFNNVGNNYAISSKGVGDALLRSAAAMRSAGNTLDETVALSAAANTVVQDPDKVGTTLKTVSMFLRAAKTEAEEAGESTDGMANSISELRDELLNLTGNKVDIQTDENTFKSTYQILKDLSSVWNEFTDISQANILEMVGGKRNSNVVSALLENFSVAEKAIESSANSEGSAIAENEKVLESLQGRLNILKATFQDFSQSFISSDFLSGAITELTKLLDVLNAITETAGPLPTTIGAITLAMSAFGKNAGVFSVNNSDTFRLKEDFLIFNKSIKQIESDYNTLSQAGRGLGIRSVFLSTQTNQELIALKNFQDAIRNDGISKTQAYEQHIANLSQEARKAAEQIASGAKSVNDFGKGLGTLSIKAKVASVATTALNIAFNMLMTMGVAMVIQGIITGLDYLIHSTEKTAEAAETLNSALVESNKTNAENRKTIASLNDEYQRLSKGVDSAGNNISLTSEEYDRYKDIVSQISDIMPNLTTYFDAQGEKIGFTQGRLADLNKELDAYQQKAADKFWSEGDGDNTVDDIIKNYNNKNKLGFWANIGSNIKNTFGFTKIADLPEEQVREHLEQMQQLKDSNSAYKYFLTLDERSDIGAKLKTALGITESSFVSNGQYADDIQSFREEIERQLEIVEASVGTKTDSIRNTLRQSLYMSSSDFYSLNDEQKNIASEIISNIDNAIFDKAEATTQSGILKLRDNILAAIKSNPEEMQKAWTTLLSPDINLTVNEYETAVDNAIKTVAKAYGLADENGNVSEEVILNIKTSFNIDDSDTAERDKLLEEKIGHQIDELKNRFTKNELELMLRIDIPDNIKESIDELKQYIQSYNSLMATVNDLDKSNAALSTQINKVSAAWSNYALIAGAVNKTHYLTNDEMSRLITAFPDLEKHLTLTKDGWILESSAMDTINNSVIDLQSAYVQAQAVMTNQATLDALQRMNINAQELASIQNIAQAYAMLAQNGTISLKVNAGGSIDTSALSADQQAIIQYAQSAILSKKSQDLLLKAGAALGKKSGSSSGDKARKAQTSYDKKVREAKENYDKKIRDLDEKEYNAEFENSLDAVTRALEKYTKALERLQTTQDNLYENDYAGKIDIINSKYAAQAEYSSQLQSEMERLLAMTPETSAAWDKLASSLENISSNYFESQRAVIEYRNELIETAADANKYIAELAKQSGDLASKEVNRIQDILKNGSFVGELYDVSNMRIVPKSAVEKERAENKKLEKEQERYQARVQEIRQKAIDEAKAYEDEQRRIEREEAARDYQEALDDAKTALNDALSEASDSTMSTIQNLNDLWQQDTQDTWNDIVSYLQENNPEILAKIKFVDDDGNEFNSDGRVSKTNISANGTSARFDGRSKVVSNTNGVVYGDLDVSKNRSKIEFNGQKLKSKYQGNLRGIPMTIFPDGSAIWEGQNPENPSEKGWFRLPEGSISMRATGGASSGLTEVNEGKGSLAGREGYVGEDNKLHWFDDGAQLFNADKPVHIISAPDMQKIIQNTGYKYFNEPIGDLSSVTQYASGNTSISFPTIPNSSSPDTSNAKSVVAAVLNEINNNFETLKSQVDVSPVKKTIYNALNDKAFYSKLGKAIGDNTESTADSATQVLYEQILKNSMWDDLSEEVQERFLELGASKDTWDSWIDNPDNAMQAIPLMSDGTINSWDMLGVTMQNILIEAGIADSVTWTDYVNNHPLEALILLTKSWDDMTAQIAQYINDSINICINGANAIHKIAIEAPEISQESWDNLQTLIANKIQEILTVINETFSGQKVDLNFNVKLSGNEQTNPQGVGANGSNSSVISTAKKYLGTPYVWGGTSPSGFDCSGFTYYVMGQNGKTIPRTADDQFHSGTAVGKESLSPGDLVFFGSGNHADHVGVYEGNGMFIHSPHTGDVVKESSLNSTYYTQHYIGARRYATGTKDYGIAGENYKLEWAINKQTGSWSAITEPTLFDKNKYDIVGEKVSSQLEHEIPVYAKGTYSLKDALNSVISNSQQEDKKETRGVTIDVPPGLGKYYTYMNWDTITNMNTRQGDLIKSAGKNYDSEGYGKVGERYALAMTSTFGAIGDYVDIYMADGRIIHGILADAKSQQYVPWDHNPANKWGHNNGQCMVEFVTNWKRHANPPGNGGVLKVVNVGNYFGNPSFAGVFTGLADTFSSKLNEIYSKLKNVFGTYATNTHTVATGVAPYRYLGNSRQSSYDFDTPFTKHAKGTRNYGIAGENYRNEWAINKRTGEWTLLDRPTLFDKDVYDIVDENTSAKISEPIPMYAKGTLDSTQKGYLEKINNFLSDDEKFKEDDIPWKAEELEKVVKRLEHIDEDILDENKHISKEMLLKFDDFYKQLDEIETSVTNDEISKKLIDITEKYQNDIRNLADKYKSQGQEIRNEYSDWFSNDAGSDKGFEKLFSITEKAFNHTSSYQKETNKLSIEHYKATIAPLNEAKEKLNALYAIAPTATEKQKVLDDIEDIDGQIEDVNDSIISIYEAERDRITSDIGQFSLETHGTYGTGVSYLEKDAEKLQKKLDKAESAMERSNIYNELIENSALQMERYEQQKSNAHNYLENMRNSDEYRQIFDNYKIDEMFDADNEFNDKYYETIALLNESSPELVQDFLTCAHAAQEAKKSYTEAADAIEDINETTDEYGKNQALELVDTYLALQDRLIQIQNYTKSMNEAVTSAKQQMYDIYQTLRNEQMEIEAELRGNKHLETWLDKDTREQLFNENDYKTEMKTMASIKADATKLYKEYQRDISKLTEEDAWKEASITAEYNKQVEALNERLEVAKQELDTAKKRTAYENALKERDTQVIMGGIQVMIHDPDDLYNKAQEVAQAEITVENTKTTNTENADIRDMQRISDSLDKEIAAINNRVEMINSMTEEERISMSKYLGTMEQIDTMLQTLTFANPYYIVDTDSTDRLYRNLDTDKISHGYKMTYDYEGHIPVITDLIDKGAISASVGDALIKGLKVDHDYKTTTDTEHSGYIIHNPSAGFIRENRLMRDYTEKPVSTQNKEASYTDIDEFAVPKPQSDKFTPARYTGESSKLPDGWTTSTDDGVYPKYAPIVQLHLDDNGGLLVDFLRDNIQNPFDSMSIPEMNVGTQDNSMNYNFAGDIVITNPVGDANTLANELINQVNSEYSVTKNMR